MHRSKLSEKGRAAGQAFFLPLSNCGISAQIQILILRRYQGTRHCGKQIKTEKSKICCEAALKCNNTPTDMLACRVACFAFNAVCIRTHFWFFLICFGCSNILFAAVYCLPGTGIFSQLSKRKQTPPAGVPFFWVFLWRHIAKCSEKES